jgi:hypothetical protein
MTALRSRSCSGNPQGLTSGSSHRLPRVRPVSAPADSVRGQRGGLAAEQARPAGPRRDPRHRGAVEARHSSFRNFRGASCRRSCWSRSPHCAGRFYRHRSLRSRWGRWWSSTPSSPTWLRPAKRPRLLSPTSQLSLRTADEYSAPATAVPAPTGPCMRSPATGDDEGAPGESHLRSVRSQDNRLDGIVSAGKPSGDPA